MSEKVKQVLETMEKKIPNMTELEMAHLMGFCEGLAAREDRQNEETTEVTA